VTACSSSKEMRGGVSAGSPGWLDK